MILVCLGMIESSQGQYFNIRDYFHSSTTVLTSVTERNDKYYVTGICIDSSNYLNPGPTVPVGAKFAVFDNAGNKIRDTFYQKNTQQVIEPWCTGNQYSMPDGSFIVSAQYTDSNLQKGLIIKFDSLGNKLWEKSYDQPLCNNYNWYAVTDLKPTGTGEWLMLGDISCYFNATQRYNTFALTKLDSNFNIIWSKQFGDPPNNHTPTKIFVEQDGYILAGGTNNANLVLGGSYFQPELTKVDTGGNVLWTWVRNQGGYYNTANDVIKTKDGGYVYCGQGNGYIDGNQVEWKGWIEKIDSGRHTVWNKVVSAAYTVTDYNELNVLKELPDSSIVVAGGLTGGYDAIDSNYDYAYGALLRLANNGNTVWQRKYRVKYNPLIYYFYDMKQTDDGGYVLVGQALDVSHFYNNPYQQGWIVKVDSNGCISPTACDATDVPEIAETTKQVKIYPNPVKDMLQISYNSIADGNITITDMTGRVLIEKKLEHSLDMEGLASGIYIYKVTEKGLIKGQGKILKE